jgi:hypothetical protein
LIVIICTWCNRIMRLFFCERVKEKFEDKKLLSKVRFVQFKNKIINMCNTKTSTSRHVPPHRHIIQISEKQQIPI